MKGKGGRDVELSKFFQVVLDVGGGNFWKFYEGRRDIGEKWRRIKGVKGIKKFWKFYEGRKKTDRS